MITEGTSKVSICKTCKKSCEHVPYHPSICVKCYVKSEIYKARHR